MAKICLCLTGKTLARNLEVIDKYRKYADLVELRVDYLDPNERLLIRRFPEMAGLPVILTIRRGMEGGHFVGGEGSRIALLARGMAYAVADKRRNFAYVDLEEDLDVPGLEEAARAFGTRIIRSWHNMEGVAGDLAGKLKKLRRVGDELVKVAVTPRSLDDVVKVYQVAKETTGIDKILLCMGEYSANTRILAELMGSRICYASPIGESDLPQAGPGQLDPRELVELYRFREITANTRVFAVTGYPLKVSDSPYFFNTAFKMEKIDAVYVPIPADSIHSLIRLAEEIDISGISITVPYKEEVLSYLAYLSKEVASIGACNTVVAGPNGWAGYNTDATGFSESLLDFIGRKDLRGRKISIIGSGGSARAVAAEVHRLKGKALVINRTVARARNLAEPYRFAWAGLDSRGADLMEKYSNIIIQASSVGMTPDVEEDPVEFYKFSGRETVMDLIYRPEKTRCLKRAEKAGCRILNGSDMLHRQARIQYNYFLNKEFPLSLVSRAGL
ncbi:MAG: type I 3-dehydroquinate dehydratase [Treponema sp.]|jgi:3-dehydroquinate dehydratase/shikimate dehydrogenase|nr:type I 3-dehydroquinate dehydratase [Treponema sp.]